MDRPQALGGGAGGIGQAAQERPRYGELNLFMMPGGTPAAAQLYGRSYLELASDAELRERQVASLL